GVRHIWIHEGKGEIYLTAGYRTKEGDSFESIQPGDQLTVTGDEEVKGRFRYWWIENLDGVLTHISTTCNRKILNSNKNGVNQRISLISPSKIGILIIFWKREQIDCKFLK
ncbi:MAG: hypothetical protein ACE5PV_03205, partial [Candidatus Poribacteria bacterium]